MVSATPVTGSVAAPRQDCFQGEQIVQRQPSGAGAVIGAIAGGVISNQFGHGFGRAAATGLGAVAGSAIGNNVEANANPPTSVPVRRCRTVNGYESRVIGYDVVYEYNGQRYTTRLPSDPGPRLAIDIQGIDLNPALRDLVRQIKPGDPYIDGLRVGQYAPGVVRIVFDLKQAVQPQVFSLAPVAASSILIVPIGERSASGWPAKKVALTASPSRTCAPGCSRCSASTIGRSDATLASVRTGLSIIPDRIFRLSSTVVSVAEGRSSL